MRKYYKECIANKEVEVQVVLQPNASVAENRVMITNPEVSRGHQNFRDNLKKFGLRQTATIWCCVRSEKTTS